MSKVVLCESARIHRPYEIRKIHKSFSSFEELCYLVDNYLEYFLVEGIEPQLEAYLKEEWHIQFQSRDIVEQLKIITRFRNYFSSEEMGNLNQRIRTIYLYSNAKKQMVLGNMYLLHQMYAHAMEAYQKCSAVISQLKPNEQLEVWYHMGLCQSKMFCFEEARESFKKALTVKQEKNVQEAYFLTAYASGDYYDFLKVGKELSFDENQCQAIYQNIEQREEEIKSQDLFVKMGKIDYHRKRGDDVTTRRMVRTLLEKWKDEYREENA